jgi:hypothetical protein
MPFVKIDCGILNSTLWFDREAREVFMTALLMAEPQDFPEPIPQLRVDALKETGWSAPAGWYGFVPASGPGIIDRAKVSQDDGRKALIRLGEPEKNSRSPEFGGRRLIRINGGYLVLNYMKYRERDYTAAERQKRYRDRLKADESRRNNAPLRRKVTQAEAEAEVDTKKDQERKHIAPKDGAASAGPGLLANAWNELTHRPIPKCRELTASRKKAAERRLKERPLKDWREVIRRIQDSDFCRGQSETAWVATFDWLLKPDTAVKVLEGKYDNREGKPRGETAAAYTLRSAREFRDAVDLAAETFDPVPALPAKEDE